MRLFILLASALLIVGCGKSGNNASTPPTSDAGSDAGAGGSGADAGTSAGFSGFIDVHVHCKLDPSCTSVEDCCKLEQWTAVADRFNARGAAFLSTEHYAVSGEPGQDLKNEAYAAAAAKDERIKLYPSLECWHDTPFDSLGWAAACREDVDRWKAAGAVGFKDHIGKQFDGNGDAARWLGLFNRHHGFCTVANGDPEPNAACMRMATVRYPAREAQWREVVRYIVEDQGMRILTHATSWFGATDQCWDPEANAVGQCVAVTRSALLSMAEWAKSNISEAARRRIVVAHLGFFNDGQASSNQQLNQLMATGVSTETAATIGVLAGAPCRFREGLSRFHGSIFFGTDAVFSDAVCTARQYDAWEHFLTAPYDEVKRFELCSGPLEVHSAAIDEPKVDGCEHELRDDALEQFLHAGFESL